MSAINKQVVSDQRLKYIRKIFHPLIGYSCPMCYVVTPVESLVSQSRNNGQELYTCKDCAAEEIRKGNTLKTNVERLPCSFSFPLSSSSSSPFSLSKVQCHYKCIICNLGFWTQEDVVRHVSKIHSVSYYTCLYCREGCANRDHAKKHLLIHTGEELPLDAHLVNNGKASDHLEDVDKTVQNTTRTSRRVRTRDNHAEAREVCLLGNRRSFLKKDKGHSVTTTPNGLRQGENMVITPKRMKQNINTSLVSSPKETRQEIMSSVVVTPEGPRLGAETSLVVTSEGIKHDLNSSDTVTLQGANFVRSKRVKRISVTETSKRLEQEEKTSVALNLKEARQIERSRSKTLKKKNERMIKLQPSAESKGLFDNRFEHNHTDCIYESHYSINNSVTGRCLICGLKGDYTNLLKHMDSHDLNQKVCVQCSGVFQNKSKFILHMLSHELPRPFKCLRCAKAFKTRVTVFKHLKNIHGIMHMCPYCKKETWSCRNASKHMKLCKERKEKSREVSPKLTFTIPDDDVSNLPLARLCPKKCHKNIRAQMKVKIPIRNSGDKCCDCNSNNLTTSSFRINHDEKITVTNNNYLESKSNQDSFDESFVVSNENETTLSLLNVVNDLDLFADLNQLTKTLMLSKNHWNVRDSSGTAEKDNTGSLTDKMQLPSIEPYKVDYSWILNGSDSQYSLALQQEKYFVSQWMRIQDVS